MYLLSKNCICFLQLKIYFFDGACLIFFCPIQLLMDSKSNFWGVQNTRFWGKMAFLTCSKRCKSALTRRGLADSFADVIHLKDIQNKP